MPLSTNPVPSTGTDEELRDWFLANFNTCGICHVQEADYLAVGSEQKVRVCNKCAGFDKVTLEAARRGSPVHYNTTSGKLFIFYVLDKTGWPMNRFQSYRETNMFYKFDAKTQKVEATEWTEDIRIEVEVPVVGT